MTNLIAIGINVVLAGHMAAPTADLYLYAPTRKIADQGIAVKAWGSGSISETDEVAYEGANSLRVSTRNYFQGGMLNMAKPVDLNPVFADKNNLLMVAVRTSNNLTLGGGGRQGGGRPGAGEEGSGGGARGGGGLAGSGGQGLGAGGSTPSVDPVLRQLRLIVTTSDGMRSEGYIPVPNSASEKDPTWKRVGFPLQAIAGLDRTNKQVTSIAFAGDTVATFYIGEMKIINDSTPIQVEPNVFELNLGLGEEVELIASGYGGATVLRYTWDFDAGDGIQVDAEGQVFKRKFRKPGSFTITLTAHDVYGLKKSASATIKAVINP